MRDIPPTHFKLRIKNFSLLVEKAIDRLESRFFKASGYKWRLCVCPSGNRKRNGDGYISLYLAFGQGDIADHWQVYVSYKFFVYDQIRGKYLTIQDFGNDRVRRFHTVKLEWGIDQVLSLETFKDPSNGYLLDDTCVFGAEVFVHEYSGQSECFSLVKVNPLRSTFSWRIDNFSLLDDNVVHSQVFTVEESKWKMFVYPKGNDLVQGKYLSVFLELADWQRRSSGAKLYAGYIIRIKDPVQNNHYGRRGSRWFDEWEYKNWGFPNFILLSELENNSKGFVINNSVIVEVEFLVMSESREIVVPSADSGETQSSGGSDGGSD
ncbi:Ubiquitinyl hydrolase 1 [Bertholletia excelsa]